MKKLNQLGVVHWTTILPVVVMLAIAAIGVKVLTPSHAATGVTNGQFLGFNHILYSKALVYQKQFFPGQGTTTNCSSSQYLATSFDNTKAAEVCQNTTTSKMTDLVTYTANSGLNFKKIATVPTASWPGQLRWQKAKIGTTNLKLAAIEYNTTTGVHELVTYDSVTGARKVVKVGGTSNFLGSVVPTWYDWSNDGKKILYASSPSNNLNPTSATSMVTLCSVDVSVTNPVKTCNAPVTVSGAEVWDMRWSRDGTKLVVVTISDMNGADTAKTTSSMYVASSNLSGLKLLTKTTPGTWLSRPLWSPDGTLIEVDSLYEVVTPYKSTVQIRSSSTGAVTKQAVDTGNTMSFEAWL